MAAEQVFVNVHDHGMRVVGKSDRIQCKYCDKVISGSTRLKYHLGGVRGDVTACQKVPENVKESFRSILETRTVTHGRKKGCFLNSNGLKKSKSTTGQTSDIESGTSIDTESISEDWLQETAVIPSKRVASQTTLNAEKDEDSSSRQPKKCVGRFFYETNTDFSVVNSPSFQLLINGTVGCGKTNYKVPSLQELNGWILQEQVKEVQEHVEKIRQSWARTGCRILFDGWIDEKGRNLVTFIVDCPQGPVYLKSSDVSAFVDNVDALQLLLDGVIKDVGVQNVLQVISFSSSGWVEALGKQFMDRYRSIFWTLDASYCLELILDKMAIMDEIRETLGKAKVISKLIHGHPAVLSLLRNYTDCHYLLKPSRFRSAMPFLTLDNLISEKQSLSAMFASSEWKNTTWASRIEGKSVASLVADPSFWKGAEMVIKATMPLVKVLRLINGDDKRQMGHIYETMDPVKETIKEEFNEKESQYMPLWQVIDEIWDGSLHSALHAAGYYLNPSLFYSDDFHDDSEVAFGLLCCIIRLAPDQRIQDLISRQLEAYRHSKGAFSEGSSFEQSNKFSPASWWSVYGEEYPELQQFATRILSQTCAGATKYRLKRSLAEKMLTNGRNPLKQQVLSDLEFVHYNLQLQKQHSELGGNGDTLADEIDPMDDWIVDTINGGKFLHIDIKDEPQVI